MDDVVATSQKTAGYLDRPAHVVMHGIDTRQFSPPENRAALRERLGLPDGFLIGCYGRVRHQKGTDVFVEALVEILPHHPDLIGIVMGRATEAHEKFLDNLKAQVSTAGLAERILFLPEVPVSEMAAWYQALDLYVAPQRWEGFGLTPLEAMACGVPVVAGRVGAFDELIVDGETGAMVNAGGASEFAGAIETILGDREALGRMGAAARRHVEKHFTIETEAAALVRIYRNLLATRTGRADD